MNHHAAPGGLNGPRGDSEAEPLDQRHLDAIADADLFPYWYDDVDEPESNPTLVRTESCDLCIVGGGYTGLWTAIIAKERDPSRDVVLIDANEVGSAASGRNGGFMESSLTHGVANGQLRFPDEIELLEQLGLENLNAIEDAIQRYGIDCDYERTGVIDVATTSHAPNYVDELSEDRDHLTRLGQDVELLDTAAMQAEVHSPTYTGGLWRKGRAALVDPARLVWGMKAAAESLGVRIYEDSKATEVARDGVGVLVTTPLGRVRAARVALCTNAFPPLLRRISHYIAPVYDYCMVTEPLTAEQLASIGWANRQGLSDIPNQFHYYRLTEDNRILWGGYDAVYYWRGKVSSELESRPATWAKLSQHFFETFPQLDGVRFSHIWGGAIDTSTRFCVFWGTAMAGRVAYAVGYTGLGVAATRFGADVMLDLLDGRRTRATNTEFVRKKPLPFPPEPFRFAGIQATRWSLDREDRTGKRNLWLRSLDRRGLGVDSG
jgi:glycine/D-amino acid oxidase-like deaminating enzyme